MSIRGLPSVADNLLNYYPPLSMYGIGNTRKVVMHRWNLVLRDVDRLQEDHANAASSSCTLVLNVIVGGISRIPRSERAMCARDHAIAYLNRSNPNWL